MNSPQPSDLRFFVPCRRIVSPLPSIRRTANAPNLWNATVSAEDKTYVLHAWYHLVLRNAPEFYGLGISINASDVSLGLDAFHGRQLHHPLEFTQECNELNTVYI